MYDRSDLHLWTEKTKQFEPLLYFHINKNQATYTFISQHWQQKTLSIRPKLWTIRVHDLAVYSHKSPPSLVQKKFATSFRDWRG